SACTILSNVSRTWPCSIPTMATPRTTSCRWSRASTSATETLNEFFSRSRMLRTTCRLSLRDCDSRTSRRTRMEPTIMTLLWTRRSAERPLHLLDAIALDAVADLDVVVAGDLQAALHALADLTDVVLEALEGLQPGGPVGRRVDHHAAADHPDLGVALHHPLGHEATGDRAHPADL